MLHVVIMAGGKGSRFWPVSREETPKQLISLAGDRTMLQATVDRIMPLAPADRMLVVAGAMHADAVREQLPDLPDENLIIEPVGRNTAPCVLLAAMIVNRRDPDGTMAIFPADHLIAKPDLLIESVNDIAESLESDPGKLGAIGIKPAYPETGYGYIKRGESIGPTLYKAEKFMEKPDHDTAQDYVSSGEYYWNSGMFFWKARTIIEQMKLFEPQLCSDMAPLLRDIDTERFNESMDAIYPVLKADSIDYAVMEKAGAQGNVLVAECDPGWNDVGSWRALYDIMTPGADGSRCRGESVMIDSRNIVTYNDKRLVAAIGVEDLIIVETDDALLVCHKDKAQDVRKVVDKLKDRGRTDLL